MERKRLFSTLVIAFLGFIIIQINSTAASPAEDAIAGWFQSLKDAGATTAKYDALSFDAATDTVTIENPRIDWRIDLPVDDAPVFNISFTTAQIVIIGFRKEADGYSAKQYYMPENALIKVSGKDQNGGFFTMDSTIEGAKWEGVFYPLITPVPEDAQRPVSRYLHYYDLFLKTAVKKSSVDKITINQTLNGEDGFKAEYNDMTMLGLENGRLEEMRVKSYRQIVSFSENNGDVPFDKMETTYGEMLQRGVDMRPVVDALRGKGTGPDADYRVITEEASVSDVKILVGPVNVSIDSYRISGVKIRPGKLSLMAMLDRLALGEEIDEKETLAVSLDLMRSFAMDELSISNMQGSGPENVTARMGKFIIENLSNLGLGNFAIENVEINGPGGEKVRLDLASIGNIVFPSVEDIMTAVEQGPPDNPAAAAALAPKVGKLEIGNLFVDDKKKPPFSLGLFRVLQSGFIGAIPTDIRIDTENFELPVAYIEDPMAQAMLQSLGYNVLKIASKIALKWDERSQDLTLENADITLDDGVKIKLKAGVAGLPKSVIENPQNFMQAMATLAFRNVNFLVEDAVLVSGLIDYFAKMQNMPPEGLRTMIVQIIDSQAGPLTGTPFVEELKTALGTFLENPKRLSLDLTPNSPVPFTQMLGTVSTAPDQMPTLLGANVSAN